MRRNILLNILLMAAALFITLPSQAADESAQVMMLRKVFASPVTNWKDILNENRRLIDNSFFERVESRIRWSLDNGQVEDAIRFAYVGDLSGLVTNKKTQYRLHMAQLFRRRGNITTALDIVASILMTDPKDQEARFYQASLFQDGGDTVQSYNIYQELARENYHRADCYYRMGLIDLLRQDILLGKQHFEDALKADAKHADARKELDQINTALASATFIPATADAKTGIPFGSLAESSSGEASSAKAEETFNLAEEARLKGDLSKAADLYNTATTLNPGYGKAFMYLGAVYYRQKNIDAAITSLDKAVKLEPNNADAVRYLGSCYEMRFDNDGNKVDLAKAIDCYKKAQQLNPSSGLVNMDVRRITAKYNNI